MMTLNEFAEKVREGVEMRLGADFEIQLLQRLKNNSQFLTQLSVRRTGENTGGNITLDSYYADYQLNPDENGIARAVEAAAKICRENEKLIKEAKEWAKDFGDYQKAKDRIMFKVINAEMNQQLLETVPHVSFLDLAIVFYLYVEKEQDQRITALIHNHHLDMWNVTADEVYQAAKWNTPRKQPYKFSDLSSVMRECMAETMGIPVEILKNFAISEEKHPLYILSNENEMDGAAAILYPDVMKQCAEELGGDLVVFPSSVHEVIFMRSESGMSLQKMKAMVHDINMEQVPAEEVLSNHVYYYDHDKDRLEIAA